MIQHFVLTRFNIASPGREAAIRNSPGWLARRFDLFETFCLPALAAQKCGPFDWLIYFDARTPEQFRERIERARAIHPFEARFVGLTQMSDVASDVTERLKAATTRVLTTRIDNDDAIARDFLARTQRAAEDAEDGTVLNFPSGLSLRRGRVYSASDNSNPFTSLVEARDNVRTIWSARHRDLGTRWDICQVEGDPAWLQVVHGENVANRIKGPLLPAEDALANFTLGSDVQLAETGAVERVADRLLFFPLRRLREAAISLLRLARDALRQSSRSTS